MRGQAIRDGVRRLAPRGVGRGARIASMRVSVDDHQLLEDTRSQLIANLARVPGKATDWEVVPGAITIGESLLHIAAVEFLFATALTSDADGPIRPELWRQVSGGFARELGIAPPRGRPVSAYLARLAEVREMTRTALAAT